MTIRVTYELIYICNNYTDTDITKNNPINQYPICCMSDVLVHHSCQVILLLPIYRKEQ